MSIPTTRRRGCLLLPTVIAVMLFATLSLGFLRDGSTSQQPHRGRHPNRCRGFDSREGTRCCDRRPSVVSVSLGAEIGVGIDLGTTNSAIAFLDEGDEPRIIEIPNNGRTMKSVVAFDQEDPERPPLVGNEALEWEVEHRETAYRHVKRVIGTSFNNLSDETRQVVPHLVPDPCGAVEVDLGSGSGSGTKGKKNKNKKKPFKKKKKKKGPSLLRILEDADNYPTRLFSLHNNNNNNDDDDDGSEKSTIYPEDVSSCVLQRLLSVASEHTGDSITRAVIGVPAYFNDVQKEATIRAAKACGIEKVKLLKEPEAAALAYGFGKDTGEEEELVLVFDLGGGTYDVSVLTVGRGLTEIMCTSGNAQLGGTNFDHKIARQLSKWTDGCCKTEDSSTMVLKAAEAIRISLSNNRVVNLALPTTEEGWMALTDGKQVLVAAAAAAAAAATSNSTHVFHQFSRREFEKLCAKEFQDLIRPIREVAIMAGAMLPGDTRPSVAESAMEREKELAELERFYYDEDDDDDNNDDQDNVLAGTPVAAPSQAPAPASPTTTTTTTTTGEIDIRSSKKAQQKGRKKAREVAKRERKFREESRKAQDARAFADDGSNSNAKVRADGISGRPISRIVLVGGATRMPTIGRIISSLTGVTPQRTVDPDEAVALGCAVHVGVLDGKEEMGVVLNPMKAALLKAAIEKERREGGLSDVFDDDDEFGSVEVIEF